MTMRAQLFFQVDMNVNETIVYVESFYLIEEEK